MAFQATRQAGKCATYRPYPKMRTGGDSSPYLKKGVSAPTKMKDTLQAQDVQSVIRAQIARREKRIDELRARTEIGNAITIGKLEHAVSTLIELEHVLRLCGCPDEAYASKEKD